MAKYVHRVLFSGCKKGAIGMRYTLPAVYVQGAADDRGAIDAARAKLGEEHEKLTLSEVKTIPLDPVADADYQAHVTLPETPAAKKAG